MRGLLLPRLVNLDRCRRPTASRSRTGTHKNNANKLFIQRYWFCAFSARRSSLVWNFHPVRSACTALASLHTARGEASEKRTNGAEQAHAAAASCLLCSVFHRINFYSMIARTKGTVRSLRYVLWSVKTTAFPMPHVCQNAFALLCRRRREVKNVNFPPKRAPAHRGLGIAAEKAKPSPRPVDLPKEPNQLRACVCVCSRFYVGFSRLPPIAPGLRIYNLI